jgi:hypothetical protein
MFSWLLWIAWESSGIIPGVSTSDLAMFSDQDLTHYRISAGASYSLLDNISVFGKWKFEEYNDRAFMIHGNGGYVAFKEGRCISPFFLPK